MDNKVDISQKFADTLIQLLEDNNMKQKDLAKKLFISDATMSYYVKGRSLPSFDTLLKIAKEFNVSIDTFFDIKKPKEIEKMNTDKNSTINIPVYKDIKYNYSLDGSDDNIEFIFPVVSERYKNRNRLFAKIVTTDEMNPRIMKNDIIIFEAFSLGVDKISDGDICLVCKGNDNAVLREMAIRNEVYCFNPFNVTMPPRMLTLDDMRKQNITILGRAIKLIHEFKQV